MIQVQETERGDVEAVNGIDVSQWQGNIDYEAVAGAGIEFVYIKATEGIDLVDPFFYRNYAGAGNAGLPVGFYHYLTARSPSAARQEAYHFVSVTEGLSAAGRMVMDIEDLTGLTRPEINQIALAFLQGVEEFSNRSPALYADAYNASAVLEADLSVYPLWIAQYGVSEPDMDNPWNTWAGWQYTDLGRVAGIQGNVDRDIFTEEMLDAQGGRIVKSGTQPPYGVSFVTYIVQPGDTVYGIARKYHVSPGEIIAENELADPNLILPGQALTIEIRDDRRQADTYILYRVRPGDTIYSIAARYGTTMQAIEEANHIPNPNLIYSGQIIKIPRFS